MSMTPNMRKLRVVKKKYDGSLCDEYAAYLVDETDEIITLFTVSGTSCWDYRKAAGYPVPDGLLEIFFKRKWYNVWHIAVQNLRMNRMYINIAMPPVLRGETLEWVDLDLDYRVHLDNSVERIDEEEVRENAERLRYPPELIEQVQAACREVEAGLEQRGFPFDYERQAARYQQIKGGLESESAGRTFRIK